MGLESATYISQLVGTNPDGADDINQGDNHLRLLKSVLQSQFPNLGAAAVTATASELAGFVPTGCVIMWTGTSGNIPTGWTLCDGTSGAPNLTSRFIYGGTSSGATGGNNQMQLSATDAHTLSEAEMPSHTHGGALVSGAGGGGYDGGANVFGVSTVQSTGGDGGHSHNLSFDSTSNMPAYYTLVYIMKT